MPWHVCTGSRVKTYTNLRSDIAIAIRALSPSPLPNWESASRRGEVSIIFDCNLVLTVTTMDYRLLTKNNRC
jgi:hypothetical protein